MPIQEYFAITAMSRCMIVYLKNVSFFPVLKLENCSFICNNLSMAENDLGAFQSPSDGSEKYSLMHMKHSEGVMQSTKFQSNVQLHCFWVTGGNITFINMIAIGNNEVQVGRTSAGTLTINNATVVSNTGSIFYISDSIISISSCTFKHNSDLSESWYSIYIIYKSELLTFDKSDVTVTDSVFEENSGQKSISIWEPLQNSVIAGSQFRFNYNVDYLLFVKSQWLQILSSIFESNDGSGSVIYIESSNVVINGSMFNQNHRVVVVWGGSAEFMNCIFATNYVSFGNVVLVNTGLLQFTDCSLLNNTASLNAGIILARYSVVDLLKCIAANNSASSEAGVISILEHSIVLVESSTFESNSCGIEGGAIRAHRNTRLNISHSILHSNTALETDGGAIFLEAESQMISDSCQFIGNTAALGGGAVMVRDHSSYADMGSTFINNTANSGGRAISTTEHSLLRLENSTFEYSSCGIEGGAIRAHRNTRLNISHCKGKLSVGVQRICRRFSRFAYVDVRVGKCLLTSCERVIQKKTLNPFDVNTIWWDALL